MKKCKQCKKELNSYYECEFCSKECQRTFNHKNRKCKIIISHPCRSDQALIDPLVKTLEKEDWCNLKQITLIPGNYLESYKICEDHLNNNQYDLIICIGDRIEILSLALASFFSHQKIVHLGAGITNSISTYDDLIRHQITILSDLALCEDGRSANTVISLWDSIQRPYKISQIQIVGNPYEIDDVDESLVPSEPYDLVLLNPETLSKTKEDIFSFESNNQVIVIDSNPDQKDAIFDFEVDIFYENLPRPQFLGLLKNATRFITNSSSAYYEAPHFLRPEQIIQVGERNKNRSTPRTWNQDYKTSEKIVQIIKKWWLEKNENDKR